jgi:hypothetical protein
MTQVDMGGVGKIWSAKFGKWFTRLSLGNSYSGSTVRSSKNSQNVHSSEQTTACGMCHDLLGCKVYLFVEFIHYKFKAFSTTRLFSVSNVSSISRKPESKIRTPSKKALAAKARRRVALASKADTRFLKLPLKEAITVLRVGLLSLVFVVLSHLQLYRQ